MAWYPVVGAVQGLIAAVVWYVLSGWLSGGVMAAVILGVLTLSNGGFHLDGFADTVDGLAGGSTPEERLRIMRDHTTGAVGVVFIVLVLIIKYAALASVPSGSVPYVLIAFPAAARWAMVPVSCWSPYARKTGGLGAAYANNSTGVLASATIAVVVISVLFVGLCSLPVLAVIGAAAWLMTRFFKGKLGGVTGDVYGFVNESAEVLFLLGALVIC
jgi:adenosylcobinamide-GDP ribazoletransferase